MEKEIWRPITGYEKTHLVSNLGRVKRIFGSKEHLLKPYFRSNKARYYSVTMDLRENGTSIKVDIHRLVAKAFIPNPKNKPEVNHKFGVKTDNRASQLEWTTTEENKAHAKKLGLLKRKKK